MAPVPDTMAPVPDDSCDTSWPRDTAIASTVPGHGLDAIYFYGPESVRGSRYNHGRGAKDTSWAAIEVDAAVLSTAIAEDPVWWRRWDHALAIRRSAPLIVPTLRITRDVSVDAWKRSTAERLQTG